MLVKSTGSFAPSTSWRWLASNAAPATSFTRRLPQTIFAAIGSALPMAAKIVCGNRLVKDVAGAALEASHRHDVLGANEPVLLTNMGQPVGSPAVAAMMHIMGAAKAGHPQAKKEMKKLAKV